MMWLAGLSLLLLLNYMFLLGFVLKGLRRLASREKAEKQEQPTLSVIVPFRNEEENLKRATESLLALHYPEQNLELIFVDDYSTDNSKAFLENHPERKRFRIIEVRNIVKENPNKKKAIEKAVAEAKGEIVFITDADCTHSEEWLKCMLKYFDEETAFVAGPVLFESGKNTFGELQKIEFAGIQVTAAGLIGAGKPTTCSAANIAFRKKVFLEVDGYSGVSHLASGDDELLMQKIDAQTNYKIGFALGKDCVVRTKPNKDASQFLNQRRRWASKSLHYQSKLLIAELFSVFLFYLLTLANIVLGVFGNFPLLILGLIMFLMKMRIEYSVLQMGLPLLFPDEEFKGFLLAEFLHIPYIILAAVLGALGGFEWKGRRVKR